MIFASLAFLAAQPAAATPSPRLKPAAPDPVYISMDDKQRLLTLAETLKKKQFSTAPSLLETITDPIARNLGQWMYLMAEDPLVDFNAADVFLDAHINWPMQRRIADHVEGRIPDTAPATDVLAFFDVRDPVSGEGKIQLARALYATGNQDGGDRQIRDAWINHNFKLAEEQRILSVHGGRLSKADHAARVDRLLWSRQVTNARRVFSRLSGKDRRMAEARAALLLSASSAPRLYNKLSTEEQLDSGLLHAAVRYYRRSGEESRAIALAALAPEDPAEIRDGARWWDERQLLMRWALKNGRFADAYTLAAGHRLTSGGDYAEAEFYAGWIALRFLNAPARAEVHFLALASDVSSPISVSRANYWLGRAAAANGARDRAREFYARAARHYYSYYGQLANEALGDSAQAKFSPVTDSSAVDRALFASRPSVAALRILTDLDLDYEFMVFAYHVDGELERPGEYIELAKLTDGEGAPHLTVRAGKVGIQRGAFAPQVAYPLVFVPEEAVRFVAPEVILGLSRQESEFNPRAYSRAGARGVMQLIPSTARLTARKEGLTYNRSALLDDPVYNMTIGSAHLSHLLERFDGSLVMTFAAYNAGAARVDRWINEYGDPRSSAVDPLDWVELIPFSETRNYVQRVLENVQVYRGRLNDRPIPGRLHADIERGGPSDRVAATKPPSIVLANAASSYGATALPPLPERTAERARRYAQELTQPAAPAEQTTQSAPAAVSPIALSAPEATATAPTDKAARANNVEAKLANVETAPAPIIEPAPEGDAGIQSETMILGGDASMDKVAEILRRMPAAEAVPETSQDALPRDSSRREPERAAPVLSLAENDAATPDAPPAGAAQTTSPTADKISLSDEAIEECLAYRDFIARNSEEEETAAADLNAGMLAELKGGGAGCDTQP